MDISDNACPFTIHCFVGHEVKCSNLSLLSRIISSSLTSCQRVIDS